MNTGCRRLAGRLLLALSLAFLSPGRAQNLVPNPEFAERPAVGVGGWQLSGGTGTRLGAGVDPALRPAALGVEGTGRDSNLWRTEPIGLNPGGVYRMSFVGRRGARASGGTAFAGLGRVSRDFPLTEQATEYEFILAVPTDATSDFIRLGQWEVKGALEFARPTLTPVRARHTLVPGGIELGEGESIREGRYRFAPDLNWRGANFHRPLVTNRVGFNSNRWLFSPGAESVYRFELPGVTQRQAWLRTSINHHSGGALEIDASRDGVRWVRVAGYDGERRGGRVELPASLFPAERLFVRLAQPAAGAGFQVDTLDFEAALSASLPEAEGATAFLEVLDQSPLVAVDWDRRGGTNLSATIGTLNLTITNRSAQPLVLRVERQLDGQPADLREPVVRLDAGRSGPLTLAFPESGPGEHVATFHLRDPAGGIAFSGATRFRVGFLEDTRFGYRLKAGRELGLWWCESGWKVGRDRPLPAAKVGAEAQAVRLSAARGEYEAVQIVLHPTVASELVAANFETGRGPDGRPSAIETRLAEVAYVHVEQATDSASQRGWYPDPLPPLQLPLALAADRNQPLWLTVRVPTNAPAGMHRGRLQLRTRQGRASVLVELTVYDFTMPAETHLHSALGLGTGEINRYHHLTRPEDQHAVFESYLANFAAHRISPYSFYDDAPIRVSFEGPPEARRARVDFTAFDAAASKWLDAHHFSTFQLPLRGMGGGTFQSRQLGELEGHAEGTPEHARLFQDYLGQVERHLRERGWLGKAFTYWFDEPDPKDYDFVIAGQRRIKAAAPGIRRMLTEQPEPALLGHVDIWCGLTPEWTRESVRARRDAGEEVWWYICTGPKAPYVTEFIDHPGTELRLWPWQSWQYGVQGILIWATVYWNGPLVYPEPTVQDPWVDPMSWMSGYGNPFGTRSPWGNGDGRFLYPPRRDPNASTAPDRSGPIDSVRWENLRDGMEDYEYLWLLQQEISQARSRGAGKLAKAMESLLEVPADVSRDLTHFTTDPRTILAHRDRVARAIETLRKAR